MTVAFAVGQPVQTALGKGVVVEVRPGDDLDFIVASALNWERKLALRNAA